ncbi:MAG TPA: o-succinylbenzoate synthase [Ignavibacteriaceae bacterium]|nr:o-succinylbenzoate synthase [Ignavibacteriaceae bacterium]
MSTFSVEYSPYSLKLKKPFATSKGNVIHRSGFIIKVTDENGNSGTGDCSPFPEFGSESLEAAQNKLVELKSITLSDLAFQSIRDSLNNLVPFPALKSGLEQALLELSVQYNNQSLMELFGLNSSKEISVNGVIGFLSLSESIEKAKSLMYSGFETIKIKTGRNNFDEDFGTISEIRNVVGDGIKIRIDSNGRWNLNEAITYLKKLEPLKIEYSEQPVNTLEEFIQLKKESTIPLAPDESIRSLDDAKSFIENDAADYLILKPMMIGGILTSLNIINQAKQKRIRTIITSSFQSAIGRKMDVLTAALVNDSSGHGLSIADYFENDLIDPVDIVKNGKIVLRKDEF